MNEKMGYVKQENKFEISRTRNVSLKRLWKGYATFKKAKNFTGHFCTKSESALFYSLNNRINSWHKKCSFVSLDSHMPNKNWCQKKVG